KAASADGLELSLREFQGEALERSRFPIAEKELQAVALQFRLCQGNRPAAPPGAPFDFLEFLLQLDPEGRAVPPFPFPGAGDLCRNDPLVEEGALEPEHVVGLPIAHVEGV